MANQHWHIATVTGRGSDPMAEKYEEWAAAVAAKRQLERQGGGVLTVRACNSAKCADSTPLGGGGGV